MRTLSTLRPRTNADQAKASNDDNPKQPRPQQRNLPGASRAIISNDARLTAGPVQPREDEFGSFSPIFPEEPGAKRGFKAFYAGANDSKPCRSIGDEIAELEQGFVARVGRPELLLQGACLKLLLPGGG